MVYLLSKCVWWVPDSTVERYAYRPRHRDAQTRADGPFVAHSTRFLVEVVRPAR